MNRFMKKLTVFIAMGLLSTAAIGNEYDTWKDVAGGPATTSLGKDDRDVFHAHGHLPLIENPIIKAPLDLSEKYGRGFYIQDMAQAFRTAKFMSEIPNSAISGITLGTTHPYAVQSFRDYAANILKLDFVIVKAADGPFVMDQFDADLEKIYSTTNTRLFGYHRITNYYQWKSGKPSAKEVIDAPDSDVNKNAVEEFAAAQVAAAIDVLRRSPVLVVMPSDLLYDSAAIEAASNKPYPDKVTSTIVEAYCKALTKALPTGTGNAPMLKPSLVFSGVHSDNVDKESKDHKFVGGKLREVAGGLSTRLFWLKASDGLNVDTFSSASIKNHKEKYGTTETKKAYWAMPQTASATHGGTSRLDKYRQSLNLYANGNTFAVNAIAVWNFDGAMYEDVVGFFKLPQPK